MSIRLDGVIVFRNAQPHGLRASAMHAARTVLCPTSGLVLRHTQLHLSSAERLRPERRPVRIRPKRDRGLRIRVTAMA